MGSRSDHKIAPDRRISQDDVAVSGTGALECFELFSGKTRGDGNATRLWLHDPNGGKLLARSTVTNPSFWISLHVPEVDVVRYVTFEHGKYYEQALSEAFAEILLSTDADTTTTTTTTSKHVIDVGGNIGWYSLLSMALGSTVDVFEPNPLNLLRFCESL